VSRAVREFYNRNPAYEWERLERPYTHLEYVTTMHLVDKYFPKSGAVVDIGSGPGRYSIAMMERGYEVVLVDLSERLLEVAQREIVTRGLHARGIFQGDACNLHFLNDARFDAAFLMGPMYHLIRREDRLMALAELRRVLKPGGVAVVAYLNSWGIIRSLLTEVPEYYRSKDAILALTREFINEARPGGGFTEAYFTVPPKALEELREAAFAVLSYAGAESYASGCIEPLARMKQENSAAYRNVLETAAMLSEESPWRDSTEHIHFVVKKE